MLELDTTDHDDVIIDLRLLPDPAGMPDRSEGLHLVCIDSGRAFVDALAVAISAQDGIASVQTGSTVDDALEMVRTRPPHAVLMGIDLEGRSGLDGAARIKAIEPTVRVVLLTAEPTMSLLLRAAAAGADALVSQRGSFAEILDSLRADSHSGIALNPTMLSAIRADLSQGAERHSWNPGLSAREFDVLELLAEGLDPKTIATRLRITLHTCRGYIRSILTKLGAHTQLEAVVVAARIGLVTVGSPTAATAIR